MDCTLCYKPLEYGQDIKTLQCGHNFHRKCIQEWFELDTDGTGQMCPECASSRVSSFNWAEQPFVMSPEPTSNQHSRQPSHNSYRDRNSQRSLIKFSNYPSGYSPSPTSNQSSGQSSQNSYRDRSRTPHASQAGFDITRTFPTPSPGPASGQPSHHIHSERSETLHGGGSSWVNYNSQRNTRIVQPIPAHDRGIRDFLRYDPLHVLDPRLLSNAPVTSFIMINGAVFRKEVPTPNGFEWVHVSGPMSGVTPSDLIRAQQHTETISANISGLIWKYTSADGWNVLPSDEFPQSEPAEILLSQVAGDLVVVNGRPCVCLYDDKQQQFSWWARSRWTPAMPVDTQDLSICPLDVNVTKELESMIWRSLNNEPRININGRDYTYTQYPLGQARPSWKETYLLHRE